MRFDKAFLVTKKDWEEIFQSRLTLVSIVLPYFVPVAIPVVLILVFRYFGGEFEKYISVGEMEIIKKAFPVLEGMDATQIYIYMICALLVPLLFIIFSLASISIITADSFAGEKERKTIEALFASPLTDLELYMGKLLASFIPSIILTYIFYAITIVIVNVFTVDIFGFIWYPTPEAAIAVFLIAPLYAFLGMTLVIWGSSRAATVRDSSNYAGILILPVLFFIISMMVGFIVINVLYLIILSIVLFFLDIIALYICYRTFDREKIIASI